MVHGQNRIQYTIRARYERATLEIAVCHMASGRKFRNEFTASDFPEKSLYGIARTLIHGITASEPLNVHEYGQWCYLSLSGHDIPSFALRPIMCVGGGAIIL